MKNTKLLNIIGIISIVGLLILFLYSLYKKEYMQSIMCIAFSISPICGIFVYNKSKEKL
ncbi:hypothetical protein [Clostridium septicum]|uniref:Uncharacterized protein n=1 Tax=Clostridium septicum TaxID=1504 RepID=A0ABY5AXZ8_CLOSE|nr:hypothetical protein [Clostridium septicum]MDU1313689.1 hypothetical protein [Clostridium septicum]UEC21600.1 hypothetical protein LK444_04310 [Clostridium septicum]USS00351.1 hypothetical protein NH397_12770 [Clostridium septicum]WLF68902.1 hypothetical protein Q6375_13085 [Clostridium septicum]